MPPSPPPLTYRDAELVIGLVAPLGANLQVVETHIQQRLGRDSYQSTLVRLSDRLPAFGLTTEERPETPAGEIHGKMDQGNALRKLAERNDALALAAIRTIRDSRPSNEPRPRHCFILHQLKHPDEIETLREVYGVGFFLLGIASSSVKRREALIEERGISLEDAQKLLARDEEEEGSPHGQRTRKAFHLADAFVSIDTTGWEDRLRRILDLVMGDCLLTPTRDEYAMYMAFAASLRSGDLSRQVGAVVTNASGDILSTGANDVPAFGGGQYWPNAPGTEEKLDQRDYVRGYDSNAKIRDEMVLRVAKALLVNGESDDEALLAEAKQKLSSSGIMDITEFGRAVHAEMAALMSCARNGITAKGSTLYSTTFPCHNCTKHIVAAGITEVLYVEPYPKSRAHELHSDAVHVAEGQSDNQSKVVFRPFEGIGPRRFMDLFSMNLSTGTSARRKDPRTGKVLEFNKLHPSPRLPMQPTSYLDREKIAVGRLRDISTEAQDGETI